MSGGPHLELVAVPEAGARGMKPGARYALAPENPLRLGTAPKSRIAVDLPVQGDADYEVGFVDGRWTLRAAGLPHPARLNGRELARDPREPLVDGDHLVFEGGLTVAFFERPRAAARDAALERRLAEAPEDDAGWRVYADFLLEKGDPLGEWMLRAGDAWEVERLRWLGPLSAAVARGRVLVEWGRHGFLVAAALPHSAVPEARWASELDVSAWWYLERLAALPVARFLQRLEVDLFLGGPPGSVRFGADAAPDVALRRLGECVASSVFAPSLRELRLGYAPPVLSLPALPAALATVKARAPHLASTEGEVVVRGTAGVLVLEAEPPGVQVAGVKPGDRVVLGVGRNDVGTSLRCPLRLLGQQVPPLVCALSLSATGEWTIWDTTVDPLAEGAGAPLLKVNGASRRLWLLRPRDVVEPLPGLRLRFEVQ